MFPLDSKILIVDDMPTIRELVRGQLRAMGYTYFTLAEDGEIAWNVLLEAAKANDPFNLVIADWMMPNVKGLELLKRVRANPNLAKLPFIMLTSESERDQVTEAVLAGVTQYIVKPFSPKSMDEKLRSAWTKYQSTK